MQVIAAAFGLSEAATRSGAAKLIARLLVAAAAPSGEIGLYCMIYLATMIFSAVLTNSAAITISTHKPKKEEKLKL